MEAVWNFLKSVAPSSWIAVGGATIATGAATIGVINTVKGSSNKKQIDELKKHQKKQTKDEITDKKEEIKENNRSNTFEFNSIEEKRSDNNNQKDENTNKNIDEEGGFATPDTISTIKLQRTKKESRKGCVSGKVPRTDTYESSALSEFSD